MNLFYPSHDIALGNGVKHFNPPFAALRLQEDLAALSAMWQNDGNGSEMPTPWGWDYDTRAYLNKEYGIKMEDLPSDIDLSSLRDLSSRKTTIYIIDRLKQRYPEFNHVQTPLFIDNEEKLKNYVESQKDFVLKTPWSSSGRGLSISNIVPKKTILQHGAATIRKMGGIVAEPWYDKIQDFAMLFYVGKKNVKFIGYSLFENNEAGTYRSGKLMSNEMIEAALPQSSETAKKALLELLNEIFTPFFNKKWEVGYVGIDMMIAKEDNSANDISTYFIHPCVEMNLRCTMGVVARQYFDKNCSKDQIGDFFITPAMDNSKLAELDNNLSKIYGNSFHRLTGITQDSMFMAYAILS